MGTPGAEVLLGPLASHHRPRRQQRHPACCRHPERARRRRL